MPRRGRALTVTLIAAVLACGCGDDAPPPDVPAGFERVEAEDGSFAHPRGWTVTRPSPEEAGISSAVEDGSEPPVVDVVRVRGPERDGVRPGILFVELNFSEDQSVEVQEAGFEIGVGPLAFERLRKSEPEIDGAEKAVLLELLESRRTEQGGDLTEKWELLVIRGERTNYRLIVEGPTDRFEDLRLDEVARTFDLR